MPRSKDPVKVALADLVFEVARVALTEGRGTQMAPAHQPLEDYVFEVNVISDLEAVVRANGPKGPLFYSIKVQAD